MKKIYETNEIIDKKFRYKPLKRKGVLYSIKNK